MLGEAVETVADGKGQLNQEVDVGAPGGDVREEEAAHELREVAVDLPAGRLRGTEPDQQTSQFRREVLKCEVEVWAIRVGGEGVRVETQKGDRDSHQYPIQ